MNIATKSTDAHTKNYHMVQIIIVVVPGVPPGSPRCHLLQAGFLDTFPVNMATPTPENRAKIFLRKQGSIAMMMPAFMPVEKIDMGLHVELTSRNEHMVTTIDPGSPASQEGTMRRPSRGTDSP